MFSISDLAEQTYPVTYKKGRSLFEGGKVFDFSYEMYLTDGAPMADICAKVRGTYRSYYEVNVVVDEECACVADCDCDCEAFYSYDGLCKHCIAVLLEYISKRSTAELIKAKSGKKENTKKALPMTTSLALKQIMEEYSVKENSKYMLPEKIYGKIELEPHFQMDYGYANVEFKIGTEMKYVLKNITNFLRAIEKNEKVRYGKKLEFYHHMEAFTEDAQRMIAFLQLQNRDKKRQRYHAYYTYSSGYERTMELDEVGIDRFFEAVGNQQFFGNMRYYKDSDKLVVSDEVKKPRLIIKAEQTGIVLELESLNVIEGNRYYYFYEEGTIYRSDPSLKGRMEDFFEALRNNRTVNADFIANGELPMFCRNLLPLIRESFEIESIGFDESLYLPPKPEFELYLDKQEHDTIGGKLLSVYGDKKYNVLDKAEANEVRDVSEELRIKSLTEPYFNKTEETKRIFLLEKNEDLLYQLVSGGLQRLNEYMTIYTTEAFRGIKVVPTPTVAVGVSLKSDLLEITMHSKDMSEEELAYLLSKYDRRKKYIRLKNGEFMDTGAAGLAALAAVREDLHLSEKDLKNGMTIVPKYRAMYLDSVLEADQQLEVEKNRDFKAIVRNMKTIEDSDYEVPESLKQTMRGYQKNGFLWLKTLRENGFGGILADDMGLGKTLQVISLLLMEQHEWKSGEKECRRSLITCPASLVYNWKKEMERFAPELDAVVVSGSVADRAALIKETREGQILITSYDLLKRDVELYQDFVFAIQVIDEAQYIKNAGTQAAKAVKQIVAAFKLALTGTPIENRLSELWSIFDYLMPGFLYSYQKFRKDIETPIVVNHDEEKMERLKKMIRPFILRRLKGDVLKDLPEKMEENLFAKLEGEQQKLYDAQVNHLKQILDKTSASDFNSSKIQILAELTKLRQLCCDPALLYENYNGPSAKLEMCMDMIENAVSGGHKVLLFSQFTTMLDRLAERLKKAGIAYYMLTGSVNKEKRMQMVESFQTDEVSVFCISLKAGGTGLNLTAADIVIHYDPWWNVAVQNQATDRAHRIGQKNVVTVYKLVSQGTIEEKIIDIQERKRALAEQVLEGEGMDTISFTKEEILELLGAN